MCLSSRSGQLRLSDVSDVSKDNCNCHYNHSNNYTSDSHLQKEMSYGCFCGQSFRAGQSVGDFAQRDVNLVQIITETTANCPLYNLHNCKEG